VSTTARSILVGPAQTQQPASSRDHLAGESRETKRSRKTQNRSVNKLKRFDDDVQDPRQNGSSQYCHQAVNGYVQQGFVGSNDPIDHRTHRSTRDHDDETRAFSSRTPVVFDRIRVGVVGFRLTTRQRRHWPAQTIVILTD